ncbi:saccharopine dehydrogenase [Halobacteriovorax sp. HLS]|uniref:saccharopine dehydrogenase n=1 Tax=Halobacteriovorax sp. HLS TaxID=2234000 RepID=UPI0013E2A2A3|nr:saccharopine dehydrogenase [Halobacteriovorax sp. HLS]
MKRLIWLRHETKPYEQRCCLTPSACEELLKLGHEVVVERSPIRVFSDEEYEAVGCTLEETNAWINKAPLNAVIVGLKELEDKDFALSHRHIHFAHVYKNQNGHEKTLSRFLKGDGKLFDLEYLVDENENRIAAFGVWAGFSGAALAIDIWAHQQLNMDYNQKAPLRPYQSQMDMVTDIERNLLKIEARPRVIVIGAKGRSGKGAVKFLRSIGIEPTMWGSKETKGKGPFQDILSHDILINCALITKQVKPFLTNDLIDQQRHLSVISDVGCDPTGPCNPLPIYSKCTTMDAPIASLREDLTITAIDHLPSLLPKESSIDFCTQLFPHLIDFLNNEIEQTPWERSLEVFYSKTMELGPVDFNADKLESNDPQNLM